MLRGSYQTLNWTSIKQSRIDTNENRMPLWLKIFIEASSKVILWGCRRKRKTCPSFSITKIANGIGVKKSMACALTKLSLKWKLNPSSLVLPASILFSRRRLAHNTGSTWLPSPLTPHTNSHFRAVSIKCQKWWQVHLSIKVPALASPQSKIRGLMSQKVWLTWAWPRSFNLASHASVNSTTVPEMCAAQTATKQPERCDVVLSSKSNERRPIIWQKTKVKKKCRRFRLTWLSAQTMAVSATQPLPSMFLFHRSALTRMAQDAFLVCV